MIRPLLILTALALPASTIAQLDPGGYGPQQTVYTALADSGAVVARVYVPGGAHPESGLDIWRWRARPWSKAFTLKRSGRVDSRPKTQANTQTFPGGALRPFEASRGMLRYNWVILDDQNRPIGYVWRLGDRLDWWSTQKAPYLPAELRFEPRAGRIDARKVRRARWTTRVDVPVWRPWLKMLLR